MRVIPYGYRIENGMAVIDEEQAAVVRKFFSGYISGLALMNAAENVGLKLYHGSAGRMLRTESTWVMAIIPQSLIRKLLIRQKRSG